MGTPLDYIVLPRPASRDTAADRMQLQAALFDTDRPVLVVPPGPALLFGKRVAIAWRDDKSAVRAVLAALRALSAAQQVHALAGTRAGTPPPALPPILAEHGVPATLHVLPIGDGAFGAALLAAAHGLCADLLVMGAYTHSAWQEAILGGVTRYVLTHADLPVLMRH